MGKRFLAARYPLESYSPRRAWLRLHEADYEPHRMKPYGSESGKFASRSLLAKKQQTREGNRLSKRTVKKTARQHARRFLSEERT